MEVAAVEVAAPAPPDLTGQYKLAALASPLTHRGRACGVEAGAGEAVALLQGAPAAAAMGAQHRWARMD